jgi:hypothetical protein
MEGAGELRTFRLPRFVIGLVFMLALLLAPALAAAAEVANVSVVAQETPYQPPEIQEVETPSWLQPLQPLARLPLWGQAAVLSAGVAGMFFVVPMVLRWVWRLGPETERDVNGGEAT